MDLDLHLIDEVADFSTGGFRLFCNVHGCFARDTTIGLLLFDELHDLRIFHPVTPFYQLLCLQKFKKAQRCFLWQSLRGFCSKVDEKAMHALESEGEMRLNSGLRIHARTKEAMERIYALVCNIIP
jgi:hypothetical protein